MPAGTYPDGFPLSPLEAISFSYFLSDQEKAEWREWLKTANSDEQLELVGTLHDIWIDNQKKAIPSGFNNNQQSRRPQQSQQPQQPRQQSQQNFRPQQQARQPQSAQGSPRPVVSQQSNPQFSPSRPAPQQQRPAQSQPSPQQNTQRQPQPQAQQSNQPRQQVQSSQQPSPQQPAQQAVQPKPTKLSPQTPPKPAKPKYTFKQVDESAPAPKLAEKQEAPKPKSVDKKTKSGEKVQQTKTKKKEGGKFFNAEKVVNPKTKSVLEGVYKQFVDNKASQEDLIKALMNTIVSFENVSNYFDVISERMIQLNDKLLEQSKGTQELKNSFAEEIGDNRFRDDDMQDQMNSIKNDINRVSRETRSVRRDISKDQGQLKEQLAVYGADIYKGDGLLERLSVIMSRIKKLETGGKPSSNKKIQGLKNRKKDDSDNIKTLDMRDEI